jgi:hypothetical protein
MACYESEVRDKLEINPMVAKAFWNEIKGHYNAGKDFQGAVKAMAQKSGLQEATVARVITSDRRLKSITNDMWLKRAKYSEISKAAHMLVDQADTPKWAQRAGSAWDSTRRIATIGHGGVFPFTHARNLLFSGDPAQMKIFGQSVRDAYSYMTPNTGKARWVEDMAKLQLEPDYVSWRRMGLDIAPGSEPVGILAKGAKGWSRRGFDALKPARLKLARLLSENLPDDLRTEESGKMLAREINYATGSIDLGAKASRIAGRAMFAPKLWFAKRMEAFQPLRYLVNAGKMTADQRTVANIALKKWAKTVAVTTFILEANDAYNDIRKTGKKVNWTDFSKPGTLWRMNVGGTIVPLSPLVETIRTPVAFVGALMATKKDLRGDAPLTSASRLVLKDFLNALHPSITGATELISGREVYGTPGHLRRLPFKGVAQLVRGEEKEKEPPVPWAEYVAEKGPIPFASGTREFVQALRDEGASENQANAWVKSLIQSALSGGAGVHTFQESPPKSGGSGRSAPRMKGVPGIPGSR